MARRLGLATGMGTPGPSTALQEAPRVHARCRERGGLLPLWRLPALARDRVASARSLVAEADQLDVAEPPVIASDLHRDSDIPEESKSKLCSTPAIEEVSPGPHLEQIDGASTNATLEANKSRKGEAACGLVHLRLEQMRERAAEQQQVLSRIDGFGPLVLSQSVWQVEVPMAPLGRQSLDREVAAVIKGVKLLDCKNHRIGWQNLSLMRLLGAVPRRLPTLLRKVDFLYSCENFAVQFLDRAQLYRLYGCDTDCLLDGVCKWPDTLSIPIEQMSSVLQFLKDEMGVQDMSKPLRKCPQLLGLRVPALKIKVANLEKIGLAVDGQLIESHCSLLCRSPVSLQDTAQALFEIFGADSSKVIRKNPMTLSVRKGKPGAAAGNACFVAGR